MIKVRKSSAIPVSLFNMKAYNGEDVSKQLCDDQEGKCYICERLCTTDFQVEHHKSQNHFEALTYNWNNLFWSCSYCNGKKNDLYDNMLHPVDVAIEEEIRQKIDFKENKAVFESANATTYAHDETIRFLNHIYNGTKKIRKLREQRFYDETVRKINSFQSLLQEWLVCPCEETKLPIIEELEIRSELLGFKYWIIKSNPTILHTFKDYIIWNKD